MFLPPAVATLPLRPARSRIARRLTPFVHIALLVMPLVPCAPRAAPALEVPPPSIRGDVDAGFLDGAHLEGAAPFDSSAASLRGDSVLVSPGRTPAALESSAATAPSSPSPEQRDELAFHLSLWGTIAPMVGGIWLASTPDASDARMIVGGALAGCGVLVGPSLGHFRASPPGYATRGIMVRLLILGATAGAVVLTSDLGMAVPILIGAAGVSAFFAHVIWDISRLRGPVPPSGSPGAMLVPVLLPSSGAVGVAVTMTF